MNEEREMLERCVVCCIEIRQGGDYPDYCREHSEHSDPSMPPIPLPEWWPETKDDTHLVRFMTGRPK